MLRKSDELSGACRRFLESLKLYLQSVDQSSFYGQVVRRHFKIASTTFTRYLSDLTRSGYLKIIGGNRYHKGFEYELVSFTEYQELKQKVTSVLDEVYEKIKMSGPVAHQ